MRARREPFMGVMVSTAAIIEVRMIHYHGTPIGGPADQAARFLAGRHALVSHAAPGQMTVVADACQSFVLDNGAFTVWRQGGVLDVGAYADWVQQWQRHPGFDWCLIPDVIDGTDAENDAALDDWICRGMDGVPVWHMGSDLLRLTNMMQQYPRIALGSSGQYPTPGAPIWWQRMAEIMRVVCDEQGRVKVKLHGLRMLDPDVFRYIPLASADSANAGRNCAITNWPAYAPHHQYQRDALIADRIEHWNSAPVWAGIVQEQLAL